MRIISACLLLLVSNLAFASAETSIRSSFQAHFPELSITEIQPSPIDGLYQVNAGPLVTYASSDGEYIMQGELVALNRGENLTNTARQKARQQAMDSLRAHSLVTFKARKQQHEIYVFTDIDCGYCRKLHNDVAELNEKGVTVHYLAFPRAGLDSEGYDKAVNVWCATDKSEAMSVAKKGGKMSDSKKCNHPVEEQFELGKLLGINGTPTILLEDGRLIAGYLAPNQLLKILEE